LDQRACYLTSHWLQDFFHNLLGHCAYTSLEGLWDMGTPGSPPTRLRRHTDLIICPALLIYGLEDHPEDSSRWPHPIHSGNLLCKTRHGVGCATRQSEDHGLML
jgi:hypothetical protein